MIKILRDSKEVEIRFTHKADGKQPVPLKFREESAGTRRFFALIGPWTDILKNGYTVFIDEIETSLHPILVKELLKLLFCDKNNPKGAQVIFTTHNPILLDGTIIRRDQSMVYREIPFRSNTTISINWTTNHGRMKHWQKDISLVVMVQFRSFRRVLNCEFFKVICSWA